MENKKPTTRKRVRVLDDPKPTRKANAKKPKTTTTRQRVIKEEPVKVVKKKRTRKPKEPQDVAPKQPKVKRKLKKSLGKSLLTFVVMCGMTYGTGLLLWSAGGEILDNLELNRALKEAKINHETKIQHYEYLVAEKERFENPAYFKNYIKATTLLGEDNENIFILPSNEIVDELTQNTKTPEQLLAESEERAAKLAEEERLKKEAEKAEREAKEAEEAAKEQESEETSEDSGE